MLVSPLLTGDDNEIQLHKDGSWSTHVMRSESQVLDTPSKHVHHKVEVISDDLGKIVAFFDFFVLCSIHTSEFFFQLQK